MQTDSFDSANVTTPAQVSSLPPLPPLPQEGQVPEGHLPPGIRPTPGRRASRQAWLGSKGTAVSEAIPDDTLNNAHPMIRHFRHRMERFTNHTEPASNRLTGIDAARGLAMIGMVAVHTLPELNEKTGRPTLNWMLFSGHSSALFALLAGVTIALLTGGSSVYSGEKLLKTRISLCARAVFLLVFGLCLNYLDFSAHNILVYYGLFFLLVLPFVRLRSGVLFAFAGFCAVFGPLAIQVTRLVTVTDPFPNPSLGEAVASPLETMLALVALGTYPAFTWMSFIFLGMAIGRMRIRREKTQTTFIVYGLCLSVASAALSHILLYHLGGLEAIRSATPDFTDARVQEILDFGGSNTDMEKTMWWLVIPTAHSNTMFSVLISAGIAIAFIGLFLMLGKQKVVPLSVLANIGSMTLTLFTLHLLFLSIVDVTVDSELWFVLQIAVAIIFAAMWKRIWKRGPMEQVVNSICSRATATFYPMLKPHVSKHVEHTAEPEDEDAESAIPSIDSVILPAFHDPRTTMQYKKNKRLGRNNRIRLFGHSNPTSHRLKK